ncbi:MAG: hypothetical protein ACLQDF_16390 [Desulfomonilia bacterium]
MNNGIELFKDVKDNPINQGFDSKRSRLYEPVSDRNKEYSVSDYGISTPPVPSMTIDDYLERLK